MVGAGHVPGLNAVVLGAALAANKLGWETVGIRDGFDGLLYPIMVRAKFAMYVAAGVITSFVLMSLIHGTLRSLGVLAAM